MVVKANSVAIFEIHDLLPCEAFSKVSRCCYVFSPGWGDVRVDVSPAARCHGRAD